MFAAFAQVIRRVDPPSEGVEMARTQSISLDVGGHDVVAHFGGIEEVCVMVWSPAFAPFCSRAALQSDTRRCMHNMIYSHVILAEHAVVPCCMLIDLL